MNIQSVQLDPLNSPHPIPWNWVTSIALGSSSVPGHYGYYRSQTLVSPNGYYAAYSRIQVQSAAHFTQSRVVSALFLENLRTGNLQTIMASSPFANFPFTSDSDLAGTIAILIPIAWSETGDRLLAREFESIFGSSIASDYAVVWDSHTNQTQTLAPSQINYSNAVLMGWSQSYPDQVLFQAGMMGDPHWKFYTVQTNGQTNLARGDRPITYGQITTNIWAGPQSYP